jgi:hypothetical protein
MRQFNVRCRVFFSDDSERILLVAAVVALFLAACYAPPDIQCQKTAEEQGKEAKRQRNHDFLELCHASCLVHLLRCQLRHQQPRHLHEQQQQQQQQRQYLYFSNSKASKLSTRTSNGPPISNRTTQSNT